jgi:predicted amino acid dehydrogenase
VVTVSSAADAIVEPEHLKPGAVVCDVARPRDVSVRVARERDDVLVIEGGVVKVPGNMTCRRHGQDAPFSFGCPEGTAYACMSETMALALEGRYESFTLGKDVALAQADEIARICARHGFELAGFRSFERAVSDEEILSIRRRAGR